MDSTLSITINAAADDVFALVEPVERWPEFLPHYRWVRRLGSAAGPRRLEMAAWRRPYPVRWTSDLWSDRSRRRLHFTHVAGPVRGMEVEWRIEPANGGTTVQILHHYRSRVPIAGRLYERLVCRLFIEAVAGKTLRRVKQVAEIPYGRRQVTGSG